LVVREVVGEGLRTAPYESPSDVSFGGRGQKDKERGREDGKCNYRIIIKVGGIFSVALDHQIN